MNTNTMQEIFNEVLYCMVMQGEKSLGRFRWCQYQGDNGMRCAIGWLILDEEYDPEMEDRSITEILKAPEFNHLPLKVLREAPQEFLEHLQRAHDGANRNGGRFLNNFMEAMKKVAKTFDLTCPDLEHRIDGEVVIALTAHQARKRRKEREEKTRVW